MIKLLVIDKPAEGASLAQVIKVEGGRTKGERCACVSVCVVFVARLYRSRPMRIEKLGMAVASLWVFQHSLYNQHGRGSKIFGVFSILVSIPSVFSFWLCVALSVY